MILSLFWGTLWITLIYIYLAKFEGVGFGCGVGFNTHLPHVESKCSTTSHTHYEICNLGAYGLTVCVWVRCKVQVQSTHVDLVGNAQLHVDYDPFGGPHCLIQWGQPQTTNDVYHVLHVSNLLSKGMFELRALIVLKVVLDFSHEALITIFINWTLWKVSK